MKLSEKGLKKIQRWQDAKRLGHAYPVDEIEFEHDDFEGFITLSVNIPRGVFLTVEEAKEAIADYIDVVAEVVRQRNKPEIKIKHPKSILILMERIEQDEVAKIGDDYNKALDKVVEEFQKQAEGK